MSGPPLVTAAPWPSTAAVLGAAVARGSRHAAAARRAEHRAGGARGAGHPHRCEAFPL